MWLNLAQDAPRGPKLGCVRRVPRTWGAAPARPTSWRAFVGAFPLPELRRTPGRRPFRAKERALRRCSKRFLRAHSCCLTPTIRSAAEMAAGLGVPVAGVRLDGGDLLRLSCGVREIFDRHGLTKTRIMASGDLNEYKVEDLVAAGTPIDLFGVGTELATSHDAPSLNVVYKLVEIEEGGHVHYKTKVGGAKSYPPGRKQVYRFTEHDRFHHDVLSRSGEAYAGAQPLLEPVMKGGRRTAHVRTVEEVQVHALEQLKRLPDELKALEGAPEYLVEESAALRELSDQVRRDLHSSRWDAASTRSD